MAPGNSAHEPVSFDDEDDSGCASGKIFIYFAGHFAIVVPLEIRSIVFLARKDGLCPGRPFGGQTACLKPSSLCKLEHPTQCEGKILTGLKLVPNGTAAQRCCHDGGHYHYWYHHKRIVRIWAPNCRYFNCRRWNGLFLIIKCNAVSRCKVVLYLHNTKTEGKHCW